MPIHGPLYIVTDDVVHPVGGDEKDPECGLITPDVSAAARSLAAC